ncbi:MAG: single-stranded-DNA-specific exonuclease RecJ [Chloroflexi bacterium]|nr:single-stranded-DNA-specific exonuclease RecJ [Chloroflexota bacterium]
MPPKTKRWQIAPRVSSLVQARFASRQLNPLIVQILYNRGITTPEQADAFLSPDSFVGNPFQLHGMNESVERIRRAIRAGEAIAVYGDFDVDGVTATVLLVQTLLSIGAKAKPYIPHRIDEGYGLNKEALQQLKEQGVGVVITVDCGVRSLPEIAFGKQIGLDMIVTDHHAPGDEMPDAFAVINPKQLLCKYPCKELSGAGVAFKLSQALLLADSQVPIIKGRMPITEDALVDLVALGTVADLVPLTGENRYLVQRGLEKLRQSERPGIQALMRQAAIKPEAIEAGSIGYTLGPRLNAAGRLESALMAYHLLATQYPGEADDLARKLEETNRERQRLTTEMTMKARDAVIASAESERLLFVAAPEFPEGIVGLIASRLSEEFYRPAVAVHQGEEESRGSARSVPEFNIVTALDQCRDLLVRHGGHAMAAGFTVRNENLAALQNRLKEIATRDLAQSELVLTLNVDAEATLSEINFEVAKALLQLAPFGYGNREPIFVSRGLMVREARIVGTDHLKLLLSDGQFVMDAIAFRQGSWNNSLPPRIDVAYQLEAQVWNGKPRLQMNVKDIKPTAEG